MDVSKLPRLSQTPKEPAPVEGAGGGKFCAKCGAALGAQMNFCGACGAVVAGGDKMLDYRPAPAGADAWISIAVGAILLLINPRLVQYVLHWNFTWTFSDAQGQPLAYTQSVFFLSDLAITAFALTLILDGLVMAFVRRRAVIWAALGFTAVTTLGNLVYLVGTFSQGVAFLSALAVAFGAYIAVSQWRMVRGDPRQAGG